MSLSFGSSRMSGMGGPPQLPFCHLCNRQFGTSSLPIHVKACKERWEREHGKKAPEPAKAMPSGARVGSREWAEFNAAAAETFNTDTMKPCPHCARTFLPDRLQVHLRSCGQGHFADPKPRTLGASDSAPPSPEGKLGLSARQRRDESPKPSKPPPPPSSQSENGRETWRMKSAPPRLPNCHRASPELERGSASDASLLGRSSAPPSWRPPSFLTAPLMLSPRPNPLSLQCVAASSGRAACRST